MACIEGKCALCQIYPNSNAGLACDTECHLAEKENVSIKNHYLKSHPKQMECYEETESPNTT